MAQITITTTPEQDAAAQIVYQRDITKPVGETLGQWAKRQLVAVLDHWVSQVDSERRLSKAAAYKLATPAEQATIDAILAQYQ
jgi:hypothetical protein